MRDILDELDKTGSGVTGVKAELIKDGEVTSSKEGKALFGVILSKKEEDGLGVEFTLGGEFRKVDIMAASYFFRKSVDEWFEKQELKEHFGGLGEMLAELAKED